MKFYARLLFLVAAAISLYYGLQALSRFFQEPDFDSDDVDVQVRSLTGLQNDLVSHHLHDQKLVIKKGITPPNKALGDTNLKYTDDIKHAQMYTEDVDATHTKDITPINSKPLLLSENICKNGSPDLIIMVPSIPSSALNRQAIRETYAQLSRDKINKVNGEDIPYIVRTMFLLGRGNHDFVNQNVIQENRKYKDIVQFDFIDSYHNLTLKMLHGFQWINQYCNNAMYVLKSDQDVFVNVALLIKQLERHTLSPKGAVFGYIYSSAKVWRFGKWAIDKSIYAKDILPRYASGTAYVISVNILQKIVRAAKETTYVKVEDAFITGIIASEKLSASLVMLNGSSHLNEDSIEPCKFVENERVTVTNVKRTKLYTYWNALISFNKECRKQKPVSNGL